MLVHGHCIASIVSYMAVIYPYRNKQDRATGGSFLDSLAAKYGVPSSGKAPPEPTDEAFEATAKRYKVGGKPGDTIISPCTE